MLIFLNKVYLLLLTLQLLLLLQVYCQYDRPRHQNLGHLNRKTNNKEMKIKNKIKTSFCLKQKHNLI